VRLSDWITWPLGAESFWGLASHRPSCSGIVTGGAAQVRRNGGSDGGGSVELRHVPGVCDDLHASVRHLAGEALSAGRWSVRVPVPPHEQRRYR
jgi:hypothetical protein